MSRNKTVFVCQECGYESPGWLGKCPGCGSWNSLVEELPDKQTRGSSLPAAEAVPIGLAEVAAGKEKRTRTGVKEFDRVLGGGLVKGSLVLVGGDPGIGKSTLVLQVCDKMKSLPLILYVSGEESVEQIKLRADRLGVDNPNLKIVPETSFNSVEALAAKLQPPLVIVDSIQTMYVEDLESAAGSVSQVREVTARLMRMAKSMGITTIILGHVTKEGAIAGPRVLEHMVDTVLYFEGDRHLSYRILRTVKNRFGSTNEIGVFEMRDTGLVEIENPSMMMLAEKPENAPGSAVVCTVEGTRPMLVEIQALVSISSFGMPRRMAMGIDYNRVTLLMAVLEKRIGMELHNFDAYVNVAGGLKIEEPACDLGVITAIASSFKNIPVASDTVFIGEIGLTGEVRAVSQIEKRLMEAARLGFKKCIVPAGNMKTIKTMKKLDGLSVKQVKNVQETLDLLF